MSSELGIADYQFHIGPQASAEGLTFGADTNIDVMQVQGLTDLDVRFEDRPLARLHGSAPPFYLAGSRRVEFDLVVRRGSLTDVQWRDLIQDTEHWFGVVATDFSNRELHYKLPGESERFLRVDGIKRTTWRTWQTETGLYAIRSQLFAHDPHNYVAQKVQDLANSGTFVVVNSGKADAYPLLTFHRSSDTRVMVTNSTTGEVVDIDGLPSASTDVVADMDKFVRGDPGLIIFVGSTNRYGNWQLPRRPLHLHPGGNSLTLNFGDSVDVEWWHPNL